MPTSVEEPQQTPRITSRPLTIAGCAFGVAILVNIFRWTLVEYLTPFLEPLLEMGVGVFFVIAFIWSIVHSVKAWKSGPTAALLPVLVCLLTATVVIFVPFTALTTKLNFRVHYAARMAVVDDVLAGKYDHSERGGGRGDLIALPASVSDLSSDGGEILRVRRQDRTLIFFFTFRGILDSFSGFVYSTDDAPPTNGDFGGNFVEIIRLRKNWFWAASRN